MDRWSQMYIQRCKEKDANCLKHVFETGEVVCR